MFLCADGIHAPQATSWIICVILIKPCDGLSEQDITTEDTNICETKIVNSLN